MVDIQGLFMNDNCYLYYKVQEGFEKNIDQIKRFWKLNSIPYVFLGRQWVIYTLRATSVIHAYIRRVQENDLYDWYYG